MKRTFPLFFTLSSDRVNSAIYACALIKKTLVSGLLPDQLQNTYIEHSRRRYEFKLCRMLIALLSLSDQKSEKTSRDDLILFFSRRTLWRHTYKSPSRQSMLPLCPLPPPHLFLSKNPDKWWRYWNSGIVLVVERSSEQAYLILHFLEWFLRACGLERITTQNVTMILYLSN